MDYLTKNENWEEATRRVLIGEGTLQNPDVFVLRKALNRWYFKQPIDAQEFMTVELMCHELIELWHRLERTDGIPCTSDNSDDSRRADGGLVSVGVERDVE